MCAVLRCKSERVIAEEKNLIMWVRRYQNGATLLASHRLRPCDYPNVVRTAVVIASVADVCVKMEGKRPVYLLSDHIWIMARLDLEGAVIGP